MSEINKKHRILIADFAPLKFDAAIAKWKTLGIECITATDTEKCLHQLSTSAFDLCIVNLLLGGIGPNKLLADVRAAGKNVELKVVVVSKQVQRVNIENAIKAGADDFVAEPFELEDIYQRILYHLAPKTLVQEVPTDNFEPGKPEQSYVVLLLEAIEVLSRTNRDDAHQGILGVLQKLAVLLESNRTSLIVGGSGETSGLALASSDDPKFKDFPVDLSRYPEVQHVLNTGSIVLIDDVSTNQMTNRIKDKVKSISIGSVMVFPVRFQSEVLGAMAIRRPKARQLPEREVLAVIQALANILASHSNVRMLLKKIYSDFGASK